MATYIGIKGVEIQTIAGDPANPIAGQVWYNTTANTLKGYGAQGTGAWAAGGTVNNPRKYVSSGGLVDAAWIAGGETPGTMHDTHEEYDGTSWVEAADLTTARAYMGGAGTNTAALTFGGWISPGEANVQDLTESWDGTSWTEVNDLNTARKAATGQGTQTAALFIAGIYGIYPANPQSANVEDYDGTSWTELADINTGRHNLMGATQGTPSSALIAGGAPGSFNVLVETFDGTSWTERTNVNTVKVTGGGAGVETFAMVWGGINPPFYSCEQWNGSAWTEVADTSVATYGTGHAGTATTAWQAAGMSPAGPFPGNTEEWATPDATKTFTSS